MPQITAIQCSVFLKFLLEDQAAELVGSRAATKFVPPLQNALVAFTAHRLDSTRNGTRPAGFVEASKVQDERREAVVHAADLIALMVEDGERAASGLREIALSPGRGYIDRVGALPVAEARAATLQPVLAALPAAFSAVASSALSGFLEASQSLARLQSSHAHSISDSNRHEGRAHGSRLAETTALLKRFRNAIAVEVELDPDLPRDLETRLFGYLDELGAEARVRRQARRAKAAHRAEVNTPPEAPDADAATG